ncbi:MAG: serine/threonine-protein phosphatase [Rhodospirillales bacterium]
MRQTDDGRVATDIAHFTLKGPNRETNQDSMLAGRRIGDTLLVAVADGVGGQPGGDVASKSAVGVLGIGTPFVDSRGNPDFQAMFITACNAIARQASLMPENATMATTLSVCVIDGTRARVGHAGDSRIYHLAGGELRRVTRDQTVAQELADAAVITQAMVERDFRSNILNSVLSARGDFELFETTFDVAPGDRVLLATDGVTKVLCEDTIRDLVRDAPSIADLARALESAIRTNGLADDATAVCVGITAA